MANLWYLSPSNQTENVGIGDYGTEEAQMNALMDAIIPHLDRCGVSFHRADRSMNLGARTAESDALGAVWYLALHSNAGGGGQAWGPIAFHAGDGEGLARILVRELLATGQRSNRSSNLANGENLYEVRMPRAKTCLLEVDFHDSEVGVEFLTQRRADAARAIARAIVEADGKQWVEDRISDGASEWAKPYTERAKALGLFTGDADGGYRWQANLTREEAATILIRMMDLLEK